MSAVIQNEYTQTDTTTVLRSFTFPYLKTSDIKVSLDGVETTAFTLPNATTIQFNSVPPNGAKIKIFRETSVDSLTATFYAGSAIKSEDLNDNFTQNLYKTQEVGARALNTLGGTMTGNLTLGTQADLVFEGATDDAHETTIKVVDPTADRTITFPNVTGTVVTTGDTGTVATGMIANDAVTNAKIADDQIDSEHYVDGSIDTQHIADAQVTTAKIADANVTTAKIASQAVTNAKLAGLSVATANIIDANVTTAKIAADAINGTKIADNSIDSEHYVDGSIDAAHLASNSVTNVKMADDSVGTAELQDSSVDTARLADNSVTLAKMTDNSVGTSEIVDAAVTTAKIANDAVTMAKLAGGTLPTDITVASANLVDGTVATADIADNAITSGKIAAGAVDSSDIGNGVIDTVHIGAAQVTTAKIADSNITTAKITDANVTTAKIADNAITIGKIGCEQTTLSDSDSHIPTSGAVVDYVAAQIAPLGGLEVIATEIAFPNTQPSSGVVISISDAGGVVVNGSGVSTTGRTVGGSTVTINGFPASLQSKTMAAGIGLMVSSTGSSQTYNYHKILAKEADVEQLSNDINDFAARYRVGSTNPTGSLDNGDLFFNTGTGKMLVYNGINTAWEEVQSIGNFFISTLSPAFDGSTQDFTLTNAPTNVQQVLLSINGVLQKPNAGSSTPSEGFALDGSTIKLASAPASGSDYFVVVMGSTVNIGTPSNNTVSTAILQDDSVTAAKIAAGAVGSTELAANAVITSKITDGSVTAAKLASGAADLLADTSPQLGGNLDVNTKNIVFGDSGGTTDDRLVFGASSDLQIYHDGSDSRITNTTGALQITGNDDFRLKTNGGQNIFKATGNAVELYYDSGSGGSSKKLETTSNGVTVTGLLTATGNVACSELRPTSNLVMNSADNQIIYLGAGNDLKIYHNGNHSYIDENGTGNLYIRNGNKNSIWCQTDGAVKLYHNDSAKVETTSGGATITGTCTATSFSGDGSNLTGVEAFPSGTKMLFANSAAPTGWTHDTSYNNRALKLVSDSSGGGTGGSNTWSSVMNSSVSTSGGSVNNHTLTTSQMPSHTHSMRQYGAGLGCGGAGIAGNGACNTIANFNTNSTGGGYAHNHGFNNPSFNLNLRYLNVIVATKD